MTIISWPVCVYAVWLFIYVQFLMSTVLVYTNICICVVSKDVDTSNLYSRCCSCAMVIMKLYFTFFLDVCFLNHFTWFLSCPRGDIITTSLKRFQKVNILRAGYLISILQIAASIKGDEISQSFTDMRNWVCPAHRWIKYWSRKA